MLRTISDRNDPEIQPFRSLYGAKGSTHPTAGKCFICEGRVLVEDALKAGQDGCLDVISVLASTKTDEEIKSAVPQETKLLVAQDDLLAEVLGFQFHRGVLACVAVPSEPSEATILGANRLLVLPRLDDQENLGLLLRSAAALGMDAVLLGKGPGLFDRRTVRVSMGAVWRIPVLRREDPATLLERWKNADISADSEIVGAALAEDAMDARNWMPKPRTALVLGPEGPGLDACWLDRCDRKVCIPMHRSMDSLNVAASGAILMFRMIGVGKDENNSASG